MAAKNVDLLEMQSPNAEVPTMFGITPHEILAQILEEASGPWHHRRDSKKTAYNLCLVSKRFNIWATPILYRHFDSSMTRKDSTEATTRPVQFLRSLIAQPHLACHVKSIDLSYTWKWGWDRLSKPDVALIHDVYRLAGSPTNDLVVPMAETQLHLADAISLFLFTVEQVLMRTTKVQHLRLIVRDPFFLFNKLDLSYRWDQLARLPRGQCIFPHLRTVRYDSEAQGAWPALAHLLQALAPVAPKLDTLEAGGDLGRPSVWVPFGHGIIRGMSWLWMNRTGEFRQPYAGIRMVPESLLPRVTNLNLTSAMLDPTDAADLISACGSLISFKWCHGLNGRFSFLDRRDDILAAILQRLRSHVGTLETLELGLMTLHPHRRSLPPAPVDFRDFQRLKHLEIDTWCLPSELELAKFLPFQIERFRLTTMSHEYELWLHSSSVTRESLDRTISQLPGLKLAFPFLRKIELHTWSSVGMPDQEVGTMHNAIAKHGVDFEYSSLPMAVIDRAL